MKSLWVFLVFFLCQVAAAAPPKKFVFELGQVRMPKETQWETQSQPTGTLYRGIRKKPPGYFLISISNEGSSLMDSRVGALENFVNEFANSLARSEGSAAELIKFRVSDRGCTFSFRLLTGKEVYGRLLQGRAQTMVLVAVGADKSEAITYINSFETMEGQFERPLSREESANRAAAGYCWVCGGLNLIIGGFLAVLGAAAGYRFWTGLRNVLISLCLLEIAGATIFSYVQLRDTGLTFTIFIALCAGLLVTSGIPTALITLIIRGFGFKFRPPVLEKPVTD